MYIHPYFLNPNGFHLIRYVSDPSFRHIIMYGGSSSAKSYSVAQIILCLTMTEASKTLVMRKVGAHILDTIYQDFKTAASQLQINGYFTFKDGLKRVDCINGAQIVFKGLDDPEKIKGISSFKRIVLDEWSEFTKDDDDQLNLRLRGREGQQKIYTFNPISEDHWIKKEIFDKEEWEEQPNDGVVIGGVKIPKKLTEVKSIRHNTPKPMMNPKTGEIVQHAPDMVVIQSTYLNNFWIVGSPNGKYGFYDEQAINNFERLKRLRPDFYKVYALAEWGVITTGLEFFSSFNTVKHTGNVSYNPELPIHISVDSNVLPYITITYWQLDTSEGSHIMQIGETLAESPNNTVRKSAVLVADRLRELGADKVFIHGDASTRAANNIDDEKRSFLDLFIDTLQKNGITVEDKVSKKNPSVAMSGEFINAIFDEILPDLKITISENCHTSIDDYASVQKDKNGAILKARLKLKSGQSYEEKGHISDTMRYLVTDLFDEQYIEFANRRKRNLYAKGGLIQYYNPSAENKYSGDILYFMPNINGRFAFMHGRLCGDRWHVVGAGIVESESVDAMEETIMSSNAEIIVIESPESYFPFVRRLRDVHPDVRAKKLKADIPRRISATSDLVKTMILFNPELVENDGYGRFVANMLDYGANPDSIEAGAVISGFIEFASKWNI